MTGPNPDITPGPSESPQGESGARDPREVIDIYLADSLANIATIHRVLERTMRPPKSGVETVLNGAAALLEAARQAIAEEADRA